MRDTVFKPAVGSTVVEASTETTRRGWRQAKARVPGLFGLFQPAAPTPQEPGASPEPSPEPAPEPAPSPDGPV